MDALLADRPVLLGPYVQRVADELIGVEFFDADWRTIDLSEVVERARRMSWGDVERVAPSTDGVYQSWLAPLKHFADKHLGAPRPELAQYLKCVVSINFTAGAHLTWDQLSEIERIMKAISREEVLDSVNGDPWLTNLLLNIWEYVHAVTVLETRPWNVTLPVADLCNARCTFCTSWIEGKSLVKLDQVRAFSDVISTAVEVGLIGHGEPLAHPQFDKICEIIADNKDPRANIYTITNGVFLRKWSAMMDRVNLRSVSISLNAASAQTHNEVMGLGPDAFDEVIGGIRDLIERSQGRVNVQITMVVTQQNVHEVADFVRLGNDLGVFQIALRSLLPQSSLVPGLNYHVLAPNLNPDFEKHRVAGLAAIAESKVRVQAEPHMWGQEVLTESLKAEVAAHPPRFITREEALKDRDLRRRNDDLYASDRSGRGRPLPAGMHTTVNRSDDGVYVGTRDAAWSYALTATVPLSTEFAGEPGRVTLNVTEVSGLPGFGLLDRAANIFVDRVFLSADGPVELQFPGNVTDLELVVENGSTNGTPSFALLRDVMVSIGSGNMMETKPINLDVAVTHSPVDPQDDGQNPFNRTPRFACKAMYYNLYLNEMYFRIVPCCYMTVVPGFEEIRFDGSAPFMEVWNSPALVELRRRLNVGPLFGACMKCAETW